VTLRARWVTLRARRVTLIDSLGGRRQIAAHAFQLFSCRFAPLDSGRTEEEAACVFNHFPGNSLKLSFVGTGCEPKLRMTPGAVYFKPTCTGAVSTRVVSLQNATKLPTHFHFGVPDKLRGEFPG
jgi:hypothetical protein